MKVFSAAQVKQWDAYTITHEPVSSTDLMERAANACFKWLQQRYHSKQFYNIFCGRGNNGGDGLALARMLIQQKHSVTVYVLENGKEGSPDFKINLKKLETFTFSIHSIASEKDFPEIPADALVIDALFGTGLSKPLTGIAAALAAHINQSAVPVISIDIPSGLFADVSSKGNITVNAAHTLSFQQPKLAFFMAENEECFGDVHILDIGLHPQFEKEEEAVYHTVDKASVQSIYKPRKQHSHKGTYGHAALVAGSYGMMGAAVLSAKSCLRSGAGKLTAFIPECGYTIVQTAIPEAMCQVCGVSFIEGIESMDTFNAVGIGPGIGRHPSHTGLLKLIFRQVNTPLVLDADALNIMAENKELLPLMPRHTILTPHPKELERLFGKTENDFERLQLALQKSKEYNCYIILKGHNTFISTPEQKGYINSTGNAGMATAGSGDVLTGILTGLLAQGYPPLQAGILGMYLHGAAGDIAAFELSQEAMIAGDIADCLPKAFRLFLE